MNEKIKELLEKMSGAKAVDNANAVTFEEGVKSLVEGNPDIKGSKSFIILSDEGSCICASTLEALMHIAFGVYELATQAPTLSLKSLKIEILERMEEMIQATKRIIAIEELHGPNSILDLAKEKLREAGFEISDDASLDELAEMAKKAMSDMVGESDEDKAE